MIGSARGIGQGGANIFTGKIGIVGENLGFRRSGREHFQNVAHSNARARDNRSAAANSGIDDNAG